jgi:hypothetical protein
LALSASGDLHESQPIIDESEKYLKGDQNLSFCMQAGVRSKTDEHYMGFR